MSVIHIRHTTSKSIIRKKPVPGQILDVINELKTKEEAYSFASIVLFYKNKTNYEYLIKKFDLDRNKIKKYQRDINKSIRIFCRIKTLSESAIKKFFVLVNRRGNTKNIKTLLDERKEINPFKKNFFSIIDSCRHKDLVDYMYRDKEDGEITKLREEGKSISFSFTKKECIEKYVSMFGLDLSTENRNHNLKRESILEYFNRIHEVSNKTMKYVLDKAEIKQIKEHNDFLFDLGRTTSKSKANVIFNLIKKNPSLLNLTKDGYKFFDVLFRENLYNTYWNRRNIVDFYIKNISQLRPLIKFDIKVEEIWNRLKETGLGSLSLRAFSSSIEFCINYDHSILFSYKEEIYKTLRFKLEKTYISGIDIRENINFLKILSSNMKIHVPRLKTIIISKFYRSDWTVKFPDYYPVLLLDNKHNKFKDLPFLSEENLKKRKKK